ncbi:uncharacterized protein LACBIDRAFT_296897 [Laccaria bicolor S238N-H82]|uniref:Predicted protein n=1 Tax=Laccaria bicolor (strain S238N-H82 / ATCC MYA-4686) TaxID=486041 RepID=B0D9I6_LACBS|nr:uncharacterized protein LACBIDRAFT_296897 [Laccaria bicolor S238N-H82]EDR08587.1 predicted protein [Laccaria bicolor S238N-H82]|eukprot:XP_001880812.1 predicted protein [Laccaria bicolor S238N-H82]
MDEVSTFINLYSLNIIPLRVVLASLTWVLHDYLVTLYDEMKLVWPQRWSFGKIMFLWIRYYTVALLIFDTLQIHLFARPGVVNDDLCVAMDPITRLAGAISLWSIEIVMQVRIYALYRCSKKIALFNGILFLGSIGSFLWIMVHNFLRRRALIAGAMHLPLPGCPSINGGIQWAQWVPATVFEGVLLCFALYKTYKTCSDHIRFQKRVTLSDVLLHDNILYFFAVTSLLIFNNLMVVGATRIPWFGFGPFHAALGIITTRMLLHLIEYANSTQIFGDSSGHIKTEIFDAIFAVRSAEDSDLETTNLMSAVFDTDLERQTSGLTSPEHQSMSEVSRRTAGPSTISHLSSVASSESSSIIPRWYRIYWRGEGS